MVEVSVIIPTLNEENTIATCIEKIKNVYEKYNIDGEIIVADNSYDKTPEIASSLGANVITPDKKGYGYAFLCGFKHAKGKYLVMGDGDNTYDFLEIPKFLEPLRKDEADLVIGSRFKGKIEKGAMPWLHRYIGNPLLTGFLNSLTKVGVSDAQCGIRSIRRDALDKMELYSHGMEFASEMIVVAAKNKLRISEVPVTYYHREGRSKLNSFSDGWRHMKFMLLYAPSYLYLLPGAFFFVIGWIMMFLSYFRINIGYIPGIHSMILGCFSVIIGFQIVYLGLFAKLYGTHNGLYDTDIFTKYILKNISLEKGIIVGVGSFLIGIFYITYLFIGWIKSGHSILFINGEDIIALTLVTIGIQIFFNSFFLSMLTNRNK